MVLFIVELEIYVMLCILSASLPQYPHSILVKNNKSKYLVGPAIEVKVPSVTGCTAGLQKYLKLNIIKTFRILILQELSIKGYMVLNIV